MWNRKKNRIAQLENELAECYEVIKLTSAAYRETHADWEVMSSAFLQARDLVNDLSGAASVNKAQRRINRLALDVLNLPFPRVMPAQARYQNERSRIMDRMALDD